MPKGRRNPAAPGAMQWGALGSGFLLRKPALISLAPAYPPQIVHGPDPNIPPAAGPPRRRAALNFSAITVNASSQETAVNSPALSKVPLRLRSRGRVRRSSPYMILEGK